MTQRIKELNDAIYTVITTQYKKDAKEAHALVTAYGYSIWKYNGCYHVANNETHKSVQARSGWRYTTIYLDSVHSQYVRLKDDQECKVDFVGFLTKPKNYEYWSRPTTEESGTALDKYDNISHAKYMSNSYAEDIEKAKTKIESLLKDIERYTEMKVRYELDLAKLRVEYGLV